jgi:hypothetical protein
MHCRANTEVGTRTEMKDKPALLCVGKVHGGNFANTPALRDGVNGNQRTLPTLSPIPG